MWVADCNLGKNLRGAQLNQAALKGSSELAELLGALSRLLQRELQFPVSKQDLNKSPLNLITLRVNKRSPNSSLLRLYRASAFRRALLEFQACSKKRGCQPHRSE